MKTITTILLSILTSVTFGQQFADKIFLYRLVDSYENDSIQYAKKEFSNFTKTKPTSIYKIIAVYHLALIADKLDNKEEAISLYKQVLELTVPDSIENNYKNYSAKDLAEIYIDKKDYKTAIKYLDLTKKKFSYKHFCGNAYASDDIYTADRYSDCYIGLGNYKKAIDILSPHMFSNGLADNSGLVKKLYLTYLKVYSKSEIKNQFLNADKSLEIKKEKYKEETYLRPLIKVFNSQVFIPIFTYMDYEFEISKMTDEQQKQKCIDEIKNSEIYKFAMNE